MAINLKDLSNAELKQLRQDIHKELKSRRPKKRKKRHENSKANIRNYKLYTLVLEGGFYYVGITSSTVEKRYKKHLEGKGAKWTKLHKPIGILEVVQLGVVSEYDATQAENQKTLEVMNEYGKENVRGGNMCIVDQKVLEKHHKKLEKKLEAIQTEHSVAVQEYGDEAIIEKLATL